MKLLWIFTFTMIMVGAEAQEIFDFNRKSEMDNWYIVNDGVMGGLSSGNMKISDDGHGIFEGTVSLENNGGFTSVRYLTDQRSTKGLAHFLIRVKGDGKNYQFRVKSSIRERHSYVYEFETTGQWQEIAIPFDEMYPSFRGRTLDMPNYPGEQLNECTFLIANKKNESFRLLIDRIWME